MPLSKTIGKMPLPPLDEVKKGTNHLFAIGINKYKNFTPLVNARKDVEDIAAILEKEYYFERKNIHLLCDEDATRTNIIDQLDGLGEKIKENDRLLIYYSGHGFLQRDRGFWIPVNAEREQVSSYVSSAEVRDIIQSLKAHHILLVSDSCFSASLLVRDASRDVTGAFVDWERNASRWVFSSGKGIVSDGVVGKNSPFAAGIIKHLEQNKEEALNIVNLADRVTKEVRFNYEQQAEISPLNFSGHAGGQFIFFKIHSERDDWQTALKIHTERAFLDYLDDYPNGENVKEAEKNLREIADEKEWSTTIFHDAAFAYRTYLSKYPKGIHAQEATDKLNLIRASQEQAENARFESEYSDKMEVDRKESLRIENEKKAQYEKTERLERERLAKMEADRKESVRIENEKTVQSEKTERLERERLAKMEADRKESARIENEKAVQSEKTERLERERLAKIEADRKESQRLENENREEVMKPSFFKRFRFIFIGLGVIVGILIGFLILGIIVGPVEPTTNTSVTPPSTTNTGGGSTTTPTIAKPNETPMLPPKKSYDYEPDMVAVDGGTFQMGNDDDSESGGKPAHEVTLKGFQIGKYEITQEQWQAVMGNNPSYYKGDSLPVESVSWERVQAYLAKLNEKTEKKYRLPTEAEWEFAAHGGTQTKEYKYSGTNDLKLVGWNNSNSDRKTHPVGKKQANEIGLYDMSGNVIEWCSDWYDVKYYKNSTKSDPKGAVSGSDRVSRGGAWNYDSQDCQVSYRHKYAPSYSSHYIGFRVASDK